MSDELKELEKFHNSLSEDGKKLNNGTIPWLISEALENIDRVNDLLSPTHDRVQKKTLKPIIRDIKDQLKELKRRFE